MKLIDVTHQFSTDDKCLDYIEKMRWPAGVGCIHCGSMSVSTINRTPGKNKRKRTVTCFRVPEPKETLLLTSPDPALYSGHSTFLSTSAFLPRRR
jgi:hypothetical protein